MILKVLDMIIKFESIYQEETHFLSLSWLALACTEISLQLPSKYYFLNTKLLLWNSFI